MNAPHDFFPGAKFFTTVGSDDMGSRFFVTLTEAVDHAFDRHTASMPVEVRNALTGEWIATVADNDMVDAVDDITKYSD